MQNTYHGRPVFKVMVKFFNERPDRWAEDGAMDKYMGKIIEVIHRGKDIYEQFKGFLGEDVNWIYKKDDLIFCPEENEEEKK